MPKCFPYGDKNYFERNKIQYKMSEKVETIDYLTKNLEEDKQKKGRQRRKYYKLFSQMVLFYPNIAIIPTQVSINFIGSSILS